MELFLLIIQALSALLLLYVGIKRVSNPIQTYAKSFGIGFPNQVNVVNELRGIGAVMLVGGAVVALGLFIPPLATAAVVVATCIFMGVSVGRVLSMAVDGKPNKQLLRNFSIELAFGLLNTTCLVITLA